MTRQATMRRYGWLAGAGLLIAAVAPAEAHTYGAHGAGLGSGFVHPFGGLDHLLAMVAIGLWASARGGADLWRLPLAFVGAMVAGAALAVSGAALPLFEFGIAGSVGLLGLILARGVRLAGWLAYSITAAVAACHGYGHGAELPVAANPALYALGFVVATGALQALGASAGRAINRLGETTAACGLKAAGTLIALASASLLAQI